MSNNAAVTSYHKYNDRVFAGTNGDLKKCNKKHPLATLSYFKQGWSAAMRNCSHPLYVVQFRDETGKWVDNFQSEFDDDPSNDVCGLLEARRQVNIIRKSHPDAELRIVQRVVTERVLGAKYNPDLEPLPEISPEPWSVDDLYGD